MAVITLRDADDGDVNISVEFEPPLKKDVDIPPAQQAAILAVEQIGLIFEGVTPDELAKRVRISR